MKRQHMRTIAILAPLVLGLSWVAASADTTDSQVVLKARLAVDRAKVEALEQRIAADRSRIGAMQVADLFGPSDEEQAAAAAAAQREDTQDSNIARLNQRANDLEDSLRRLTGQIEVLNHRLDEMDQRIERLKKDFDYKLCALSAQQLGANAASGDPNALPCAPGAATAPSAAPPAAAPPGDGATSLAPPPGVLGTLPQGTPLPQWQPQEQSQQQPQEQPALQSAATAPGVDTHAQFDTAMNMLARSQYDEARAAFRNFVDTYPQDPLAPQALYWVGDIAYVQKDFSSAARAFTEELKTYPDSTRAPESMLKLAQSLIALDQKAAGCTTLRALVGKYPSASKTVMSEAEAVRKAGGCHR